MKSLPLPNTMPPIEELIPHRGTMLLLDRVVEFEGEIAVAEYTPRRQAWYADESGNMPPWIGIELMAQTVAAHVALTKKKQGRSPKMGALLGTRSYHATAKSFTAVSPLRIRVQLLFDDASSGLGAYGCTIEQEGAIVANATLKVYEPEDFELYMEENR